MNPTGEISKGPAPERQASPAIALAADILAAPSLCGRRRLLAVLEHIPIGLIRHCERSEAIQFCKTISGLLRRPFGAPRNDGLDSIRAKQALAAAGVAVAGAAASVVAAPGLAGIAGAGLALLTLAIAIIDSRYFIIPDELNAAAMILALVNAAASSDMSVAAVALALLRGATLASVFFGIRTAYRMARGRDGIGLGDVKLAAVAGAWLDWATIPVAVEAAALSALTVHLARHLLRGRPLRRTSRLPFGLFFAPAIWLGWLAQTLSLLSAWGQ